MLEGECLEAKIIAERIALEFPEPLFYRALKTELMISERKLDEDECVRECITIIEGMGFLPGHGIEHVTKVALEAGAIVLHEIRSSLSEDSKLRYLKMVHMAGILHDIKRFEPDHAQKGADAAYELLADFQMPENDRVAVSLAIANHEAFKQERSMPCAATQLVSDALYDADKFRWGPDNFTETVWQMIAPFKIPLDTLLDKFEPSMQGIEMIRGTFRSETGKAYGPEFIDNGISIGSILIDRLRERFL